MLRRLAIISGLLLASGCLYHVREQADEAVCKMVMQPYDLLPPQPEEKKADPPKTMPASTTKSDPTTGAAFDVQTTSYMQAKPKYDLKIPSEIPGSETHLVEKLPADSEERQRFLRENYPALPALPEDPIPLPGPNGQPYSLADCQRIAAGNSPLLRQAAADMKAAEGALKQARAYPNPNMGYQVTPSNDGSTAGLQGPFVDQTIKTAGKLHLQSAAAEMDLRNTELALKRARSDLATQVRAAYYALIVAKETVRVNKSLARFTDEIYRVHTAYLAGGIAAPYEPAALRAQAYTARLAYKQSIQTYQYAWIQLVSTIGLRQLPLTEVQGRVDRSIPYFDYDQVHAHALANHTDVLTARNGIEKSRYNLKFAQVTPIPDVDFNVAVLHEFALAPKQTVPTATITLPIPLWDHNEGNIRSAEAGLMRASEEPHRVETNLTNNLAGAYTNYKNNLEALEYYRRYILPDQVRTYQGVILRRNIDQSAQFNDLVTAQQTLAADVTNYLGILGQLWTSVVTVADFLQTDDLFQLAKPHELPPLPDLDKLPAWPCCHECPQAANGTNAECVPCTTKPRQEGRHTDER
jgi:cobalt-zinc-cadmium efflux system outer membrane protein